MKIPLAEIHRRQAEMYRQRSEVASIEAAKLRAEAAKHRAEAAKQRAWARSEDAQYPVSIYLEHAADSEAKAAEFDAGAALKDLEALQNTAESKTHEGFAVEFGSCTCVYDDERKDSVLCGFHAAERQKMRSSRKP